jgi:hypothetical protein
MVGAVSVAVHQAGADSAERGTARVQVAAPPAKPSATAAVPATPQDLARFVQETVAGTHVTVAAHKRGGWVSTRVSRNGPFAPFLEGSYEQGGKELATLNVYAIRMVAGYTAPNPCVLPSDMVAGRQGAPAPDDRCLSFAQPDGTTVWIWRKGHSPSRPWTTADSRTWDVSYLTAGISVHLLITNQYETTSGQPAYRSPAFDIPDAAMIAVVTNPQMAILADPV